MRPLVLATDTKERFDVAVKKAAELLRAGEVVALPTETVYGLAANALDVHAVQRIYEIKGRPAHNPIIVHVASSDMARECVRQWPALAERLATAFWPGPLTLVLPRAQKIPDIVTAGGPTVGVRWPKHPVIQAVIRECGFPLAAPSANPFAQLSPTTAEHVRRTLGERIPLVVDGGPSQVGIESTVLDVSTTPPRLLRPGMISAESIVAVTRELRAGQEAGATVLKSPGQLPKHYSPRAKLVILNWRDDADLGAQISSRNFEPQTTFVVAHTRIPSKANSARVIVMPHAPAAFARAIYAELHRCDEEGARAIVVEALPEEPEWQALADRLKRASA